MIWTLIIVEQRNEFHFYLIFLLLDQRKLINLLFWLMIVSGTSHCIIRERNLLRSQANVGKSLQYNNDFTYCFRLEPTWSMIEPICSSHLSFNDNETESNKLCILRLFNQWWINLNGHYIKNSKIALAEQPF